MDIILSNFTGAEATLGLPGLPVEWLGAGSGSCVLSVGVSEFEEGRDISELDGEGGLRNIVEDGPSNVIDAIGVGFFVSSSDLIVSSIRKLSDLELLGPCTGSLQLSNVMA